MTIFDDSTFMTALFSPERFPVALGKNVRPYLHVFDPMTRFKLPVLNLAAVVPMAFSYVQLQECPPSPSHREVPGWGPALAGYTLKHGCTFPGLCVVFRPRGREVVEI